MNNKVENVTIGIAVKNVKESLEWYKSLLGNVEVMEPSPGTVELKITDSTWLQLDDTGYLEVGGGSSIIRFETNDIETTHQVVKEISSDVDDVVTVDGVIKYFDFKDLSGNRLSYVQML